MLVLPFRGFLDSNRGRESGLGAGSQEMHEPLGVCWPLPSHLEDSLPKSGCHKEPRNRGLRHSGGEEPDDHRPEANLGCEAALLPIEEGAKFAAERAGGVL